METKIMIVEDEVIVAEDIKRSLEHMGYEVVAMAHSGEDAIETAVGAKPELMLMDVKLGGGIDGIQASEEILKKLDIPIIYLTAFSDEKTLERAKLTQPFGYILKPFEEKELHTTIEMALYRHTMEERVKESEERYRTLSETSPSGIFILKRGTFTYANRPILEKLGLTLDEIQRVYVFDMVHKEDSGKARDAYDKVSKGSNVEGVEMRVQTPEGYRWMDFRMAPMKLGGENMVMGIATDVTERKILEVDAKRAQKMDAMAAMAFGLAHEFNNIMNTILGAAQLVYMKEHDEDSKEWLMSIQTEGQRCVKLVTQIMDVGSHPVNTAQVIDLGLFLKGAVKMTKPRLPEHHTIDIEVEDGEYLVIAGLEDLNTVIVNIIENSLESMPKGGHVDLHLSHLTFESPKNGIPEGDYMRISISDNGPGMDTDTLEHALDPFFSTKEEHKGMGLARSATLIRRHGGYIMIESEQDEGTTVQVYFPVPKNLVD